MYGLLSLSKTVTVTGLMAAVEEGLIDRDVPTGKHRRASRSTRGSPRTRWPRLPCVIS